MLVLYSFWRSTAAYRVRIALNFKKIPHKIIPVNLTADQQRLSEYKEINAHARVPTLVDGAFKVGQSFAILEYLEEKYPQRPLLPVDIQARAWVRYMSQIVVSDMHPVMNNSSVVAYLKNVEKFSETQVQQWYHQWLKQGFDALETNLARQSRNGLFCWGDQSTLADVCLVPQIYNAFKFEFPMQSYPNLLRIYNSCSHLEAFQNATPERQVDFPEELKIADQPAKGSRF